MLTPNRPIVGALALSLTVNLLLLGFLAGRLVEPEVGPPRVDPTLAFFPALRELPEARREELRPIMRGHFLHSRADIRRIQLAQRAVNDALTAEPFEPEALTGALAEFREALLASQEANHAALVQLAAALTPAERQRLAEAMRRGPRPPFAHGGDARPDDRMAPTPPPDMPTQ